MNKEKLLEKLSQLGHATNSCLMWHIDDIENALGNAGWTEKDMLFMDDTDKRMLLDDFFDEHEETITEFISDLLHDYARNISSVKPSKKPF